MKPQETIYIAVADTSMIIRSGLVSVLRRLPDLPVQVIEVSSEEGLKHCMEAHTPQILIINPQFGGWFDVAAFKQEYPEAAMKFVSLIYTMVDANHLVFEMWMPGPDGKKFKSMEIHYSRRM